MSRKKYGTLANQQLERGMEDRIRQKLDYLRGLDEASSTQRYAQPAGKGEPR